MLEGITIGMRESPEQYQAWIEAIAASLDAARRREQCAAEAHQALSEVAPMVMAGRAAVGAPRIMLAAGMPRLKGGRR